MDAEGTLGTIAEIGISLVGFAGIVGALAGEKLRPAHPGVWLPFWAMISSALGVLFAALFPLLPHELGASDRLTWAASSAFLGIATACNVAFFIPRFFRAQRAGAIARIPGLDLVLRAISILILVSQLLNGLGLGLRQSAGGFLIGLYLVLLLSSLNFVFLLYVLGRTPGSPPPAG